MFVDLYGFSALFPFLKLDPHLHFVCLITKKSAFSNISYILTGVKCITLDNYLPHIFLSTPNEVPHATPQCVSWGNCDLANKIYTSFYFSWDCYTKICPTVLFGCWVFPPFFKIVICEADIHPRHCLLTQMIEHITNDTLWGLAWSTGLSGCTIVQSLLPYRTSLCVHAFDTWGAIL